MKNPRRGLLALLLTLSILLPLFAAVPVSAEETEPAAENTGAAQQIASLDLVTDSDGFNHLHSLFDSNINLGFNSSKEVSFLTLEHPEGIGSLYLIFGKAYGAYTITDNASGQVCTGGENGFLHEFIDLTALFGQAPTSVTLSFDNGKVNICELMAYTQGEVPHTVQKWEAPKEDATDLILFSTHDDDAQLFFAGILPYYAGELGYEVLVVYMTDHPGEPHRVHELLNGLWAVGVTTYPVTKSFPDFRLMHDLAGTYATYKALGYPREVLLEYVVEQLRRFKPQVAIGHDINGEYGHGMHLVYTDLLMEAVTISNDPGSYPELAEKYGLWDVPKTYLHLYEENQIVMDWDQPLSKFNGLTAFEVTKSVGFPHHVSQYRVFAPYHVPYTYASEVPTYNPCYYGLYRSTVGEDVEKNDFFENVLTYEQQIQKAEEERLAAEAEAKRQEEERLAAEAEAKRQEEERLAAEEAARQEEERREAERRAELEANLAREAALRRNLSIALCAGGMVIVAAILVFALRNRKRGRYE